MNGSVVNVGWHKVCAHNLWVEEIMLKTFAVAMLAIAMSVGLAEARMHKRMIPGCVEGKQAAAPCACGTVAGRPLVCQRGQWCHSFGHVCTQ